MHKKRRYKFDRAERIVRRSYVNDVTALGEEESRLALLNYVTSFKDDLLGIKDRRREHVSTKKLSSGSKKNLNTIYDFPSLKR